MLSLGMPCSQDWARFGDPCHEPWPVRRMPIPVVFIPLVGGLVRHAVCRLAGLCHHQKSGTTFAMITLGIGELVPRWL